jgi:hypothetical protein
MNIWFSFLISLLLTTMVSFVMPIILCGLILISLAIASYLPGIAVIGKACYPQVWAFLNMFGNGSVGEGILILALTCGIAGFLFEALNFYRYQTLINQPVVNNQLESR